MTEPCSGPLHLHIGFSKTATTTLQRSLFRQHPQVRYLGQYVPSRVSMHCESEEVYRLLRPILWETGDAMNGQGIRAALMPYLQQAVGQHQVLVGSWEGLVSRDSAVNSEMIRRVQSVFGGCRILLTLRNPLTRLPSEYIENLRSHFVYGGCAWMGRSPWLSIERWLDRAESCGHLRNMISCVPTIQEAVRILGRENVGIFLFEELQSDPAAFYTRLCEFLGIDVARGLALAADQHLHPRRTQGEIEFLRRLNGMPLRRLLLSFVGRRRRRRVLESYADGVPAVSSPLPAPWREKIIQQTSAGHLWLSRTFSLALDNYGYPIGVRDDAVGISRTPGAK